jgi:hypothetical protein
MGDTCCYSFSMGWIKVIIVILFYFFSYFIYFCFYFYITQGLIQAALPGTYVYSVEIGGSMNFDELEGFIGNANDQIDFVCQTIAADPNLAQGFNAIGFSQGSQLLRGLQERCMWSSFFSVVCLKKISKKIYVC